MLHCTKGAAVVDHRLVNRFGSKGMRNQKLDGQENRAGQEPDGGFEAPWLSFWNYAVDTWQRNILFMDALRQRGNQYLEHGSKPVQHVLVYDFEMIMDGREQPRPCNYGLVRIKPPKGVTVDDSKRPFIVVDPRAGHGPGIGGFKPDSQVGAILNAGHPCYFIGFLTDPMPGQTIEDVGRAELAFIEEVAARHPEADGKPCVIANCQAGWAIIMLAALSPDSVGPLLIAGSPLSYWAGVRGKNPMRYVGGLLGGTWLTTMMNDLGNGIFDGAYLVQNMENLKPSNTLWTKQYNVWSKIDTEVPRYLDFERWWGGHVLLTAEEMQFITDELFVGNKLMRGEIQTSDGVEIDPRNIKSPIIIFCSHGDNITPPQQALGWILDLYNDVDEIRAYGQTIIYDVHDDIGHLGIFVSSRVGRKEHDQFTQNMDLIDVLPPGLYEAVVREKTEEDQNRDLAYGDYIVSFEKRTLDDIRAFGDQGEEDDRAFQTVARVSDINQGLYRQFASPWLQACVTEQSAEWLRETNPARLQYTLFSDNNPWMAWTKAAAESVRAYRQPAKDDNPFRALEKQMSDGVVASLDSFGDLRDQLQEQLFFSIYESDLLQALVGLKSTGAEQKLRGAPRDPAREALVQEKIRDLKRRIASGGKREAAMRSLIFAGLPEGRIDERGFEALRRIHEQTPEHEQLSLVEFKQLVRDQFFMLLLDEDAALEALPDLLPGDAAARRELFDKITSVSTAAGEPSPTRQSQLRQLAERFGIEADGTGGAATKAAASRVKKPTATARPRQRRAAPRARS